MVKPKKIKRAIPEEEINKKPVNKRSQPPATSIEGRERQLIALTIDLAEKQIREGVASSQVMTHFLKLGSTMEGLEKEKLQRENSLLQAKTEALKSARKIEELYAQALEAMQVYGGRKVKELKDDDD